MKETLKNIRGFVEIKHFDKDMNLIETRNFENLVVTTGLDWIAQRLNGTPDVMNWLAVGTDNTAPALNQTTLVAEIYREAVAQLGGAVSGNSIVYSTVLAAGEATGALTEAGIFNQATGGTMLSRVTYPVLNKGPLDTVGINWTIVIG